MNFSEWLRMAYGLFMGTSVQYIKPTNRYLFPTKVEKVAENLWVQLGGAGIVGVLKSGNEVLLINCNQTKATQKLLEDLDFLSSKSIKNLVVTNVFSDFYGGFSELKLEEFCFYAPKVNSSWINKYFREELEPLKKNYKKVETNQCVKFGDHEVEFDFYENCHSEGDLVVRIPKLKVAFMGGLFYNQIHPVLRIQQGMDIQSWKGTLEYYINNFSDYQFVPAEGEISSVEDLKLFLRYLEALTNPEVEFSECRENYDWMEIPSHTSLEENFDLLRGIAKNFITID
jgi:glyoxylase-like metal-dependent hydrolase (beta-lactamase superfamily II)